ncbi:hypothetical protein BDP27DRAFT_1364549 [Rhodocollybia butyracea]|uniref:Uncharacterized protein n=1 Tax=Rhodocollybia butyracea TaxID=206335 RepID=A0A9P5PTK2_9AGAR|nr:hypothetical protein BDP27DRAFT_1364549 [Rhodocollybia butyracea]
MYKNTTDTDNIKFRTSLSEISRIEVVEVVEEQENQEVVKLKSVCSMGGSDFRHWSAFGRVTDRHRLIALEQDSDLLKLYVLKGLKTSIFNEVHNCGRSHGYLLVYLLNGSTLFGVLNIIQYNDPRTQQGIQGHSASLWTASLSDVIHIFGGRLDEVGLSAVICPEKIEVSKAVKDKWKVLGALEHCLNGRERPEGKPGETVRVTSETAFVTLELIINILTYTSASSPGVCFEKVSELAPALSSRTHHIKVHRCGTHQGIKSVAFAMGTLESVVQRSKEVEINEGRTYLSNGTWPTNRRGMILRHTTLIGRFQKNALRNISIEWIVFPWIGENANVSDLY